MVDFNLYKNKPESGPNIEKAKDQVTAADNNVGSFEKAKNQVDGEHFSLNACVTGGVIGMYKGAQLGVKAPNPIIGGISGAVIVGAAGCAGTSTLYTQVRNWFKGVVHDTSETIDDAKNRLNREFNNRKNKDYYPPH